MVTVITKTIGLGGPAAGYDYANFSTAENNVEIIANDNFGSTDLVASDGAIVFEAVAGTYNEAVTFSSTLTTDATRNVTYKAASGSEHGGVFGAGVVLHDNGSGFGSAQTISDSHTILDGLEVHVSNTGSFRTGLSIYMNNDVIGVKIRNTLLWSQTQRPAFSGPSVNPYDIGSSADPIVLENLLFRKTDNFSDLCSVGSVSGQSGHYVITNCTFIGDTSANHRAFAINAPGTLNVQVTNCMSHVPWQWYQSVTGTLNLTGSNNFGGSTVPFPASIQGTPYPITATTDVDPGPGDWAIYDAATGALIDDPDNDVLAGGIGPDANPDVPTTDILGNTRSGATTDPGAFEISTLAPPEPALITIMRQIYQQDASFSVGASSAGVEKITHQLGPGSADYFTINSSTSATVSVPRTAHALRVICVVAAKACDVTLDLDASNSVFLGSIGGVASVQTDLTYFWSFGQVVSDGTYPRVRIVNDGFAGDQLVYLWWHLA